MTEREVEINELVLVLPSGSKVIHEEASLGAEKSALIAKYRALGWKAEWNSSAEEEHCLDH